MNTFLSRMLYAYWHEIIPIFITNGVVFFFVEVFWSSFKDVFLSSNKEISLSS